MSRVTIIETELEFNPMTPRTETTAIVIHQTGADLDPDAATIHDWHQQKGWNGCGYHYIIRKDGSIERGRAKWAVGSLFSILCPCRKMGGGGKSWQSAN